jgi:F-type H+-transporting ATPase subunit b
MPQFELTYYFSQAFWMIISFSFLYLMMAHLICPILDDVLAERDRLIQEELDAAESLRCQADDLMQRHQVFLMTVEQDKTRRIQKAFREMHQRAASAERRNDKALQLRVQKTEEKLAKNNIVLEEESQKAVAQLGNDLSSRILSVQEDTL